MKLRPVVATLGILGIAGVAAVLAGPLNPPGGPVGPTYKTLMEVEPRIALSAANTPGDADSVFKITQPGSYYLTGNISVPAERNGIEIVSHDVTIDLNGFSIAGSTASLTGISTLSTGYSNISVRNGTVRQMGQNGIDVYTSEGGTLENITARDNGGYGIRTQAGGIIRACSSNDNGSAGFIVYSNAVVENCTAKGNGSMGFRSQFAATLRGCRAITNGGNGFTIESMSILESCSAIQNADDGFDVTNGAMLRGCTAAYNQGNGVLMGSKCTLIGGSFTDQQHGGMAGILITGMANRVEENQLLNNRLGIVAAANADNNFIAKNTARGNAEGNYVISAGNEMAPVITNPGSNGFGTMTAWSNVSY